MDETEIKVSVIMLAYNHEKYVEQALRSVLDQKTNFRYEIVIGEDCSQDGTRNTLTTVIKLFHCFINIIKVQLEICIKQ